MQSGQKINGILIALITVSLIKGTTGFAKSTPAIPGAQPQGKLDTGFLGQALPSPTPQSPGSKTAQKSKVGNQSKKVALDEPSSTPTHGGSQSVETINSLTLLLKTAPVGVARNRLLLNHATALNLYAREKMLDQKLANPTDEIKKYLNASLKDVNEVLASPAITPDQKWKSHDIAGTSLLYLDQPDAARSHFLEVLKLNPPADKAGRIGFMIAEDMFEAQKFKESAGFYSEYYSKMNPRLKELAIYKLGWCMFNLNQFDQAENNLSKVAKVKSTSGIGKDALRDLAYIVTNRGTPEAAIRRVEAMLSTPEDKTAFLYDVVANLESQGAIVLHTQIVNRLLAVENDPEKRLELTLASLRVQKTYFASKAHMDAFIKVEAALKKFDEKQFPTIFAKYESPIETETQNIMRAFVDTYAARVKTPEPFTKITLGEALKEQFHFYHEHFSSKPSYPPVIAIWRDICLDLKDWKCIDEVSEIVITNPVKLGMYGEKSYLDQIAALDQFLSIPTKTDAQQKEWQAKKDLRVREFIQKYPKSVHWIQIAKFYTQTEVSLGHEKIALPILDQIMTQEPSDENFYNLQYARFKLKDYSALLKDERGKAYIEKQAKVVELYRESCLILAQRAKDAKNVDQYRFYVNNFVALSTDPSKSRIARTDFFNFLISRNLTQNAMDEFYALPAAEHNHADYEGFRVDLWKASVSNGMFDQSQKIAASSEAISSKPEEWKQRKILSILFKGQTPNYADLNSLSSNDREYFLGLAALSKPSYLIDYYKKKKPSSDSEKDMLEIAYKIELDQWQLIRTPELESIFGVQYPFSDKGSTALLPIEKAMSSVAFPELSKLNPKRQATAVQNAMDKVHDSREKVVSAIEGKPIYIQLRALESARDLEKRMGDYLLNSPIPAGLDAAQTEEYKKGIASAADEFVQQSKQFELLATKVREEIAKSEKRIEARTLPAPDMERWVWPTGAKKHSQLKMVFDAMDAKNKFGALALLDYFKPTVLKSDEAYYSIRTGVLLSNNPPAALRLYVLGELEREKKFVVLRNWASVVRRPVPGVE